MRDKNDINQLKIIGNEDFDFFENQIKDRDIKICDSIKEYQNDEKETAPPVFYDYLFDSDADDATN